MMHNHSFFDRLADTVCLVLAVAEHRGVVRGGGDHDAIPAAGPPWRRTAVPTRRARGARVDPGVGLPRLPAEAA